MGENSIIVHSSRFAWWFNTWPGNADSDTINSAVQAGVVSVFRPRWLNDNIWYIDRASLVNITNHAVSLEQHSFPISYADLSDGRDAYLALKFANPSNGNMVDSWYYLKIFADSEGVQNISLHCLEWKIPDNDIGFLSTAIAIKLNAYLRINYGFQISHVPNWVTSLQLQKAAVIWNIIAELFS